MRYFHEIPVIVDFEQNLVGFFMENSDKSNRYIDAIGFRELCDRNTYQCENYFHMMHYEMQNLKLQNLIMCWCSYFETIAVGIVLE